MKNSLPDLVKRLGRHFSIVRFPQLKVGRLILVAIIVPMTVFVLSQLSTESLVCGEDNAGIRTGLVDKYKRLDEVIRELTARQNQLATMTIPVGGIIAWHGDPDKVPQGFELCDDTPLKPSAVISSKPNLSDKFIKGVAKGEPLGAMGGSHKNSHTHAGETGDADRKGPSQGAKMPFHNGTVLPHHDHHHGFSTKPNSDADSAYNNAPEFVSLYFIIRTR